MTQRNRVVIVLDGGEVTKVLADNSGVEVMFINKDDSILCDLFNHLDIQVDTDLVDKYFNA